nr:GntR family transcriptional regulator [uncultured Leptotrichia sp.]
MLQKKALFLVTAENEIQPLINFARVFKQKYNADADVIYIKDILKYEVFPVSIEGMGLNIGANYAFKEYRELEEKTVKKLKEKMTDDISNFYTKDGETSEIVLEELKKYDLLVLVKNEKVTPVLKEILRSIFKPLIILPNVKDFKLDNLMLLDDGAYNANKTLFTFFYIFGEQKVDVLRVNVEEEDEDSLTERFGDNYNLIHKKGDTFKIIMNEAQNYDLVLMGDLRYTVMVERITGKLGVRILENLQKPIFIV